MTSATASHLPYLLPVWAAALVLAVYVTVLAATLAGFLHLRRNSSIRHRCPRMTSFITFANALIFAWALIRHTNFSPPPCIAQMWLVSIGFPLWVVALGGRLMHMVAVRESTRHLDSIDFMLPAFSADTSTPTIIFAPPAKSRWSRLWGARPISSRLGGRLRPLPALQEGQSPSLSEDKAESDDGASQCEIEMAGGQSASKTMRNLLGPREPNQHSLNSEQSLPTSATAAEMPRSADPLESPVPTSFWCRYRGAFDDRQMVSPVLAIAGVHAMVALTLHLCGEYPTAPLLLKNADGSVVAGQTYCEDYLPQTLVVFAYILLLLPAPIYRLFTLRDRFHVHGGLLLSCTAIALVVVAMTAVAGIVGSQNHIAQMWWLSLVYMVFLATGHVILVCYPAFWVYWKTRRGPVSTFGHANSRADFEDLLANPVELSRFRSFAATDLCSENVVFCAWIRHAGRISDPEARAAELRTIYDLFIHVGARHEVNISFRTRRVLTATFLGERDMHGRITTRPARRVSNAAVFDEAHDEILTLMYQHTYPRYLEWLAKEGPRDSFGRHQV
ncbi:hypothetical protein THASP1DRAFT_24805 [Thamnocephalis sphaerospora]|uniref:RGS domain-containing protein n=1 Tax=Thamnocephalis sphaerospora TaxID=78915 RepID=A0A4P9XM37_9FUNG|nr:hypothetical protein THASP1DRAFT_24805 [Thamnocephalis sphaerospora]|eukprot:RKP06967.1 hypothetical protein THASP1DRAFT_24805 [Thamnocephalis sphaerospora]